MSSHDESCIATPRPTGLVITGFGAQSAACRLAPSDLDTIARRHYGDQASSAAFSNFARVNRCTGITTRSSILHVDDPFYNVSVPPTIEEVSAIFRNHGIPLAVSAARQAIAEAGIDTSRITHIVSTTCTNSANPGFDHYVAKDLGITHTVEKILLHGIGCSGGLAALRTAANVALGAAFLEKPARVLVIALEICTPLGRSELDAMAKDQQLRIAPALFADGASSLILSNGIDKSPAEKPLFDLLSWEHRILPNTDDELRFDIDQQGWKAVLTPKVPLYAAAAVVPTFASLLKQSPAGCQPTASATDFEWALHPGGKAVLQAVQRSVGLTREDMIESWEQYENFGNWSSASILAILGHMQPNQSKRGDAQKDCVVGCAFGPGMAIEMCILRRHREDTLAGQLAQQEKSKYVKVTESVMSDSSVANPKDRDMSVKKSKSRAKRLLAWMKQGCGFW